MSGSSPSPETLRRRAIRCVLRRGPRRAMGERIARVPCSTRSPCQAPGRAGPALPRLPARRGPGGGPARKPQRRRQDLGPATGRQHPARADPPSVSADASMVTFPVLADALQRAGVRFVLIGTWGANLHARDATAVFTTFDFDLLSGRPSRATVGPLLRRSSLGRLGSATERVGTCPCDRKHAEPSRPRMPRDARLVAGRAVRGSIERRRPSSPIPEPARTERRCGARSLDLIARAWPPFTTRRARSGGRPPLAMGRRGRRWSLGPQRGSNPEIRRSVVGQMLEYAAHVPRSTADALRRAFEESTDDPRRCFEAVAAGRIPEPDARSGSAFRTRRHSRQPCDDVPDGWRCRVPQRRCPDRTSSP